MIQVYMVSLPCGTFSLNLGQHLLHHESNPETLWKLTYKADPRTFFESGANTCSCDVTGTLVPTTGWRLVDESCQKHEKGCDSSKKKKKGGWAGLAACQPQNYRTTSPCHLLCPFRRIFHYILSCVSETISFHLPVSPTAPPPTLLQPPNPRPKSSNWLKKKMPLYFPLNSFHFFAAAFCHNQTPHIKACAYFFLRWGWDSSFVTWSCAHQPAASAQDWSLFLALSSENPPSLTHNHPCPASAINAEWFRVSAYFTACAREA